jgi:formyltetrahydrofolate deformylase
VPNQPGIVARVTAELFSHSGNILEAHQFDDTETGGFFTRIVFNLSDERNIGTFVDSFGLIADQYRMTWEIRPNRARF